MASFSKSKLKAAREAISKKDYRSAREAASQVLEFEPSNYTANVFLGLACLEMGDHAPSQQAYIRATELNPEQPLAWQGLSKFYERTEQWQGYYTSLRKLMDIFMKADDAIKCAETLQKYLEIQRSRGTRQDVCDALRLLLPSSPLYPVLSTLPEPDPTAPSLSISYHIVQTAVYNYLPVLEEIVKLTEKDEEESIKREIEKRRTRLGAGRPEQIKNDVNCEVRERSTLPELYNEIINHPNTSDELRRSTENKLLQQKLQLLEALPVVENKLSLKKDLLSEVQDLCNGMVLLDIPNEMAWIFYIESMDVYDIEEYNIPILRRYIMAFPSSHLTTLLKGYFDYMRISIEGVEEEEETLPESREGTQDPISTILDASSYLSDSILAHRIVSEVYRMEEDWENGIKQAERGLQLTNKKAASYGKPLPKVQRAFRVTLAVSLVKFYPPKHHPRASVILDEILSRDPNNVQCLFSKGHVLQYSQQWKDAEAIFGTVVELTDESGEYDVRLEACEERAWCIVKDGRLLEGIEEYGTVIQDLDKEVDKDDKKAQAWWRLGMAYWNLGDEHKETAYKHFITALKRSSTFAPAFTSLGIYYAEYATPPDLDRSSKCFQKAFEIDATEGEAARRLAEGFANESEWGLVEVVARRTIEGEGGLEGGMTGTENTTSRYMPTNAWAWKALGVVELNSKNYLAATQSFQVALRADNNDFIAWQRLGEAYFKSGRHVAAMKALKQALTLKEDDWVCHLLLGEVYKAIGQYPDAIDSYQTALELQPAEITTSLALAEAHLIHSRNYSSEGFSSRAESSAIASIKVCVEILEKNPGFRRVAWKIAADAVYELSKTSAFDDSDAVTVTLVALLSYIGDGTTVNVQGLLDLTAPESVDGLYALKVAAAAYDQRISLDSLNNMAAASAHFDLATALIKLSTRILDSGNKTSILNQAKVLVQKSLRLDPLNNSHWVLWGNLHFVDNPKLAQHAYIKALERDSKNSLIWTNLGLLYLHHGDIELANHALYRAQILDPDYVLAWIGQGLVAAENQHHADSYTLFSHAVDISSETSPADFEFAKRAFERLINSVNKSGLQESEALLTPFHALDRFCKRQPDDPTALHLFALICERLNQIDLALDLVTRCIGLLEKTYEETEDEVTEERYALANGTLGRLKLASQDYSGAVSAFSICLSLLTPETSSDPNKIMRAHALFGSGLAHFKLYELEAALEMFENSLQELTPDLVHVKGHVFILLAQTLWALGSDEARETAKNQLLECITIDPQNLTAMATLAAIGILQSDDSLVDAALAEIRGLTWDKVSELDPANIILQLVVQHHLSEGREKDALSYAQRMVHMDPLNSKIRRALTTLLFQQQKLAAASSVIEGDLRGDSDDTLRLKAVAMVESTTVSLSTAQKAVMMAPWKAENWCTLAYMRSCNQENTS